MKNIPSLTFGLFVIGAFVLGYLLANDVLGNEPVASCQAANQICMDLPWPAPDPSGVLVIRLD